MSFLELFRNNPGPRFGRKHLWHTVNIGLPLVEKDDSEEHEPTRALEEIRRGLHAVHQGMPRRSVRTPSCGTQGANAAGRWRSFGARTRGTSFYD